MSDKLNNIVPDIPQEKFEFVQTDARIFDKKFDTKPIGYMKDALLRFKKNKSSVVAAIIILILVIFAIVAPIISIYPLNHLDPYYRNKTPINQSLAKYGIWDGTVRKEVSDRDMLYYEAISIETGKIVIKDKKTIYNKAGEPRVSAVLDSYLMVGVLNMSFRPVDYEAIQRYQDEHNVQILYPVIDKDKTKGFEKDTLYGGNYWYECTSNGSPRFDANGDIIPAYSTSTGTDNYFSKMRIEGDDGTLSYGRVNQTGYACRVDYSEYYIYKNGHTYNYLLGTTSIGQDLLVGIGKGARFSLLLAVFVSAINLTIGVIYGAIEGYFGGWADMVMERISDVLSGVPFIVVATLFQLHLASKVGVVPSFLFAFVLTGWLGVASVVRRQFYRFKGQEYILAARTLGAKDWRLMFKHIFPNALGTIITACVLVIPGVISTETMLSYLNIIRMDGIENISIGVLMSQGQASMQVAPHTLFYPSIFVSLLMISFNLFGNGLRDAFNPSLRGMED